jgi:hypothetical protein
MAMFVSFSMFVFFSNFCQGGADLNLPLFEEGPYGGDPFTSSFS